MSITFFNSCNYSFVTTVLFFEKGKVMKNNVKDWFRVNPFRKHGLNNCVLNDSKYYHVVGGLPADAMHDILERVPHYTVKEVLKVFIFHKQCFSLEKMNSQIASYDYRYHNDTNKPSPIQRNRLLSNDNSLKQHGL